MTATPARTERRDALFAIGTLATFVTAGLALVGSEPFVRPASVTLGVGGALLVETVFLRYPDRLLAVWARRRVAVAAVGTLLVLGGVAVRFAPWLLGAVCWGLVTYLVLLACLVVGIGNPVATVVVPGDGETQ